MKKKIALSVLLIGAIVTAVVLYKNRRAVPDVEVVKQYVTTEPAIDTLGIIQSYFYDFEGSENLNEDQNLSSAKFISGRKSINIIRDKEYCVNFSKKISEIGNGIKQINLSLNFLAATQIEKAKVVISIEDVGGKAIEWFGEGFKGDSKEWQKIFCSISPKAESLQSGNTLKIYIWNAGKETFFVDDILIEIQGLVSSETSYDPSSIKNTNFSFDFETENSENSNTEFVHSGKKSFYFNPSPEFGPVVSHIIGDLCDDTLRYISASVWVYSLEDDPDLYIVATMDDKDGKQLDWKGRSTKNLHFQKGKWKKLLVKLFENYTGTIQKDNSIKIYLWNKSKSKIYVDNFEVSAGCNFSNHGIGNPVDMLTHRFDSFAVPPNSYPLPITYLTNENIGNYDSTFLTANYKGELLPSENIFTGNFISDNENADEVVQINKKNTVSVFGYCESENNFNLISKTIFSTLSDGLFIKGNFTTLTSQLYYFNKTAKKVSLIQFNGKSENNCSPQNINATISEVNIESAKSNEFFEKENLIVAANVIGDSHSEIICWNAKSSSISIYTPDNNQLILQETITLSTDAKNIRANKHFSCTSLQQQNAHDKLLIAGQNNSTDVAVALLSYSFAQKNFTLENVSSQAKEFVTASDVILPGNWMSGSNNILTYSRTWRNEFKLITLNAKNFTANASLDFTGYSNNKNPKFYECIKVLPFSKGKNQKLSLLTILYNCSDINFNTGNCKKYENNKDIPNAIKLFKF